MIKAVIFDMDDVILRRPAGYFSQRLGLSKDKIDAFFGGVFQKCLVGEADLRVELPKVMREWGWEKSMEELLEFWFAGEKDVDARMVEYIHRLKEKGVKVYIGTNNEKHRLEYLEKEIGLSDIFHEVYGSYLVGYAKPDPAFFAHIVEQEKLEKDKTLFWDDKRDNVLSATSYGIKAEVFTSYEDFLVTMKKYL